MAIYRTGLLDIHCKWQEVDYSNLPCLSSHSSPHHACPSDLHKIENVFSSSSKYTTFKQSNRRIRHGKMIKFVNIEIDRI